MKWSEDQKKQKKDLHKHMSRYLGNRGSIWMTTNNIILPLVNPHLSPPQLRNLTSQLIPLPHKSIDISHGVSSEGM